MGQAYDAETLERLRKLYVESGTTLVDIHRLTGVKPERLSEIARYHKWPMRRDSRRRVTKPKTNDETAIGEPADPAKLLVRIQSVIDATVQQMQRRVEGRTIPTAQDEERQMRAMAALMRNLEKVTELKLKIDQSADRLAPADLAAVKEAHKNAEALRRDIAGRIARLQRKRDSGTGTGSDK